MVENPWLAKTRAYFLADMVCINDECEEEGIPVAVRGYSEGDTGADVLEQETCLACHEGLEFQ